MAVIITECLPEHVPQVKAFNQRMRDHKIGFKLDETPTSSWLPKLPDRPVYIELFLALEGLEVRGGYKLRCQEFLLHGKPVQIGNYQGPISEGVYDRRYLMVGVQMLRSALKQQPYLYALGMGGMDQPLPKLLQASGWSLEMIPFFFKVIRPFSFLRNLQSVRKSAGRRLVFDFAAFTGLGSLSFWCLNTWRNRRPLADDYICTPVGRFEAWADALWETVKDGYCFSAVRSAGVQNALFREDNRANIKLRFQKSGRDIGWAVVRNTRMTNDKYFGNMQLGSVVDCLALPGEEYAAVELAARYLKSADADLIITNQSHERWGQALRNAAFLKGPSNFAIACSPKLAEALGPLDQNLPRSHFNRSDGDGPIHI